MMIRIFLILLMGALNAVAQRGDKPGETQKPLVPKELIPPAPVLTPEQALATFQLPPGFRIEVVAAEPLVEDPVVAVFDPDGRLWVVEMRGFMPNVEGTGEDQEVGRVVVLEDTDGDGRMDKSTVFLDQLVMPRAILLVGGGVVIAEPPRLWFCRDKDGDLRCDEKREIASDYATGADPKHGRKAAHEHSSNGLLRALDNWIYSANHTTRFRFADGEWRREPTVFRGQWGLTQDDRGRLFYNSNSDCLRGDLVPSHYLARNPHLAKPSGLNVQIVKDQTTWPGRVNPGINRGYQPQMLRDGRLAKFTAACGPVLYRGDQFPVEYRGNAFVCEPAGNFIRRVVIEEKDTALVGDNPYSQGEFLTSTDERFRPVNLLTAPDGTLMIVDMYRGILQHQVYVTTYLRNQILERGLDKPVGLGRIYRVVHEAKKPGPAPRLAREQPADWVKHLSHPNGWWRDTAQQLLVERGGDAVVAPLRAMVDQGTRAHARLHALWTLEGLGKLDEATVALALTDKDAAVRAAAIRLAEPFLQGNAALTERLAWLTADSAPSVRLQLALTLGETRGPKAEQALITLLNQAPQNNYLRDAVLSGLQNRELSMLRALLGDPAWRERVAGRDQVLAALSQCVFRGGKPEQVGEIFHLAARQEAEGWQRAALLDGMLATAPVAQKGKPAPRIKVLKLPAEPAGLATLRSSKAKDITVRLEKLDKLVTWPGQAGVTAEVAVKPLTEEEKVRFELGKELYSFSCGMCHQPNGKGQEGLAPPIVDTDWTTGSVERLVRIVLHGLRGPIEIDGRTYELEMPGLAVFDDEQLAAILTYVRRDWGHTASPVDAETVKRIRAATADRQDMWTEKELLEVKE